MTVSSTARCGPAGGQGQQRSCHHRQRDRSSRRDLGKVVSGRLSLVLRRVSPLFISPPSSLLSSLPSLRDLGKVVSGQPSLILRRVNLLFQPLRASFIYKTVPLLRIAAGSAQTAARPTPAWPSARTPLCSASASRPSSRAPTSTQSSVRCRPGLKPNIPP